MQEILCIEVQTEEMHAADAETAGTAEGSEEIPCSFSLE